MFEILEKRRLHETAVLIKINAPFVAKNAMPGQFVILRAVEGGERVPLTIVDCSKELGQIDLIFQIVGASTKILSRLEESEKICDVVGPLGKPSKLDGYGRVCVVGGGVGCAVAYPIAKYLKKAGAEVCVVAGFRTKDLVILEQEFRSTSEHFFLMSDDGSCGKKGLVTDALAELFESGWVFDLVFVAGPVLMMKFVCEFTKKFKTKTVVSMNPIMIDGTGMCGSCRLTVGGKIRFACVDGPDFDGHLVDFDEAILRLKSFEGFERKAYEKACNLFKE